MTRVLYSTDASIYSIERNTPSQADGPHVMKTIDRVQSQLAAGEFDFSRHALHRIVERNISELEIREAGVQAVAIEHYPDDKYSPSCLLLGYTQTGKPLHIQVSLADTPLVRIVTLYEPDPEEWISHSKRR